MSLNATTLNFSKLADTVYTHEGTCSICLDSKPIYSLHQIPCRLWNKTSDGPISYHKNLYGVFKTVEVSTEKNTVSQTHPISIFHQVTLINKKKSNPMLFSPLHGSCKDCMEKIKSLNPAKCPICRITLKKDQPSIHTPLIERQDQRLRTLSLTSREIALNQHRLDVEMERLENDFENLSRSKKRSCCNKISSYYKYKNDYSDLND
jgi:hypothetical protein